jgi:hypothetical protein
MEGMVWSNLKEKYLLCKSSYGGGADYPIRYFNNQIAYEHPEAVSAKVKRLVEKSFLMRDSILKEGLR